MDGDGKGGYTEAKEIGRGGSDVEVEIRLEPGWKEPRAVIYAGADTPELQELV